MKNLLRLVSLAAISLFLASCQSVVAANNTTGTPDLARTTIARSSWTPIPVIAPFTPTPTATNTPVPPTATPIPPTLTPKHSDTPTLTLTNTTGPTAIPTNTPHPTITLTPSPAVTTISTNVPGAFGGDTATWTPQPFSQTMKEHFVFQRPISSDNKDYWARNYSFGSTDGGSRPIHHGVDFENPTGTPILAAGDGTVYYAGPDKDKIFGPQPDFYGNVIVIKHPYHDANGQPIYTLYGHLSKIDILTGQSVKTGDQIGEVGSAGVAIGPHLHFEVRAGNPTDYNAVVNPELWLIPYSGNGVIAGRVMDLNGKPLDGMTVEVQSPSAYEMAYSYADNSVLPDAVLGENFVIPDLESGYLNIFVKQDATLLFRTLIYVRAGHVTWININIDNSSG